MRTKSKARTRGQAQETNGAVPLEWLDAAVARSAETMDYSGATAKQLVDDFFWALTEVPRLMGEMRGFTGFIQRNRRDLNKTAVEKLCIVFFAEAFRHMAYLVALLTTAELEIVERANKNKTTKWFGLFMVAHRQGDSGAQNNALKNLYGLAHGIAHNKDWSPPDRNAGWDGAVNQAVFELWKRFQGLSIKEIYEHMVGNDFGGVGIVFERRQVDEIRHKYSERQVYVSDDFLDSVPSDVADPEECLLTNALQELLESDEQLASHEVGIYTAITKVVKLPDLCCMTDSQVREAIKKGAAEARGISPQQARRDWQRFLAESEKHRQRIFSTCRGGSESMGSVPTGVAS